MKLGVLVNGRSRLAYLAVMTTGAACSLTDLDGLSGGTATVDDGGHDGASPTADGAADASDGDLEVSTIDGGDGATALTKYRAAVLDDAPISYWRFEETTGTVAADEMGAHAGEYMLAPDLGQAGIAGGKAIVLAADMNAHVKVTTPAFRFAAFAPFTIELWFKPGTPNQGYQYLFSGEVTTAGERRGRSIFANAAAGTLGLVSYEVQNTFGADLSNTPLMKGRFQHIVVTFNGAVMGGYINGAKGNTVTNGDGAPDIGDAIYLGCKNGGSGLDFCVDDGALDEVAIYDHVLSATRVQLHYQLGATP